MTTLTDIAREAHVSKMTVSRVINHPEQVSDDVRKLVEKVINTLGYTPNRAALALTQSRHYVIQFLILEDIETVEPYYAKLLIYLAEELQRLGYSLEIGHNRQVEVNRVDGLIVVGGRQTDLQFLHSLGKPIVTYGSLGPSIPFIDVDNSLGTYMATTYLLEQGIENIYYVGVKLPEYFALARLVGYLGAINKFQAQRHIHQILNNEKQAFQLIRHLNIKPNSAFVAATDRIAMGLLNGLALNKIKVPETVSVIGFDGIFLNQITSQRLTTVQQPLKEIAQALIDSLLVQLEGQPAENRLLRPHLVFGGTTIDHQPNLVPSMET